MTTKAQKETTVASLKDQLGRSTMTIVSDYRGLSVKEMSDLRRQLQKVDADYTVAKNTLIRVALKGDELGEQIDSLLKGPTALTVAYGDPVAPAKILVDFMKKVKKTEMKGGVLEGKPVSADQVKAIADLPSREALVAKLLGTMQAPISGFVRVLAGVPNNLVYALEAIRKQKAGE